MRLHRVIVILLAAMLCWVSCERNLTGANSTELPHWEIVSSINTEDFRGIHFIDPEIGFVIGRNGLLLRTKNGGLSWNQQDFTIHSLSSIYFINKNIGFISGYEGIILETQNAGKKWDIRKIPNNENKLFGDFTFLNDQVGFLVNNQGELYKTLDKGVTWSLISNIPEIGCRFLKFTDDSIGYCSRHYGSSIFKTTNCGYNWFDTDVIVPNQIMDIMISNLTFLSSKIGFLTFTWRSSIIAPTATPVLKTVDGGASWVLQDSLNTPYIYGIHFFNEETGWLTGDGFYHTTNSGKSWTKVASVQNNDIVKKSFFLDEAHGWAITRKGTIYRYK